MPVRRKALAKTPSETPQPETPQKNDYVEIRLPRLRFQDTPLSSLWVILLIVFSFLLGASAMKIYYLEKEPQTAGLQNQQQLAQAPQITVDDVKSWAKELSLDTTQFNRCLDETKYQATVDKDLQDAIAAQAEATPSFYINGVRAIGALPYEQFKTILDSVIDGSNTDETVEVATGTLPHIGDANAPVTMVEFSDFECPFCMQFYEQTFPQIKKDYIDTGKVAFYYRHLPLTSLHPMAMTYANAAECANEQGKFWEMHDLIFEKQKA